MSLLSNPLLLFHFFSSAQAVRAAFQEQVEPVINEYRPAVVTDMRFRKVWLGSHPPEIQGKGRTGAPSACPWERLLVVLVLGLLLGNCFSCLGTTLLARERRFACSNAFPTTLPGNGSCDCGTVTERLQT